MATNIKIKKIVKNSKMKISMEMDITKFNEV
jgi:hypothetical protein